jgi:hemerythrin
MSIAKYPGLALHSANHLRLMEKLEAFAARHGHGGQALNQYALNFLGDWLIYHIRTDDMRLGNWLRKGKPIPDAGAASALER